MMLTSAEPRRSGMVALFVEGEHAADVLKEIWLASGFHVGDEITDEQLHGLLRENDARRAERKAASLLGYRAHSQKELVRKLRRTVPQEAAEQAAARMAELGYVDDAKYARELARTLFGRKGFAAERVRLELIRRGVGRELAGQVVSELEPNPAEEIRGVVERKFARSLGDEKGRRRAAAALRRMGYRWEDIRGVLPEFTEGKNSDDEGPGSDDWQSD